jgi:2'-5' RNA ligase
MDASTRWRMFLGWWPDAATHAALLDHAQAWRWTLSARRTRAGRLHLTLHFIGDVAPSQVDALHASWPAGPGPFALVCDRAAVWRGGIAVLEAGTVPSHVAAWHGRLAAALAAAGLPVEERPWRPHVTLARQAQGSRPPAAFAPVRWAGDGSYLLVRSMPGGRGYEPVQRLA